jgi:hypothetical protein
MVNHEATGAYVSQKLLPNCYSLLLAQRQNLNFNSSSFHRSIYFCTLEFIVMYAHTGTYAIPKIIRDCNYFYFFSVSQSQSGSLWTDPVSQSVLVM